MQKSIVSTIIKLVIASLLLGWLLTTFSISPEELLQGLGGTAQKIFEYIAKFIEWSLKYILIGAVVVVPIWLVFFAWGKFRGK